MLCFNLFRKSLLVTNISVCFLSKANYLTSLHDFLRKHEFEEAIGI